MEVIVLCDTLKALRVFNFALGTPVQGQKEFHAVRLLTRRCSSFWVGVRLLYILLPMALKTALWDKA